MKKSHLLLVVGAVIAAVSVGSANAAPVHGGHNVVSHHTVTHVQTAPRPGHNHHSGHHGGHHHVVHHHHHHNNTAGNIILATAILISAFM